MNCKICLEDDNLENLISPCICNGSIKYIHEKCVKEWLKFSETGICPDCKTRYNFLQSKDKTCLIFLSLLFFIFVLINFIIEIELKFYFF